ncbi:MAG: MerR family transcriptional regulator [Polyangiaceae bacterium]
MDDISARYRIQTVAQLTGIPAATLRAWERRYGFPAPGRSSSAYRLYSDRDVELVKRMRQLIESGIAPNEAAKNLLEANKDQPVSALEVAEDPYELAITRIVSAAKRLDTGALNMEIRRALLLDSGLTAFERVLRPALIRIGDLWHAGEISVASEHFASHLITAATLDLLRLVSVPTDAPTVLMACFAEEQHVLPLYGASLELASWAYRPVIVGARTPPNAIARSIEALQPDLVGLSVTTVPQPPSVARELVDAYADACKGVPFIIGGLGVTALEGWIRARGGLVAPEDSTERRRVIDQLISARTTASATGPGAAPPRGQRRVH